MDTKNYQAKQLLATFVRDISQRNKTVEVVESYIKDLRPLNELKKIAEIPFSSERKYSACIYQDLSLVMGAPEMLLDPSDLLFAKITQFTKEGYRVVMFGLLPRSLTEKDSSIKEGFEALCTIVIDDPIRDDIASTLSQLSQNDIDFKILSGDATQTVVSIVKKINKDFPTKIIEGSELEKLEGPNLERVIMDSNIFGRIKPHQKQLIIKVLRSKNLSTAMIGDGVNDVLAIKEADLGIAITGGSDMVKDVADIVLLNNSFSTLPVILNEGRRIIINIHNIANIYLIKNISSIVSILILGFIGLRFPFDPKHVELAGVLIIGLPSFALAFDKHDSSLYLEGFVKRLLLFSGIVGFMDAIAMILIYIYFELTSSILIHERTMLFTTIIFMGIYNILLIYLETYPLKQILRRRVIQMLLVGIPLLFGLTIVIDPIKNFFLIDNLNILDALISFFAATVASIIAFFVLRRFQLVYSLSSLRLALPESDI